MFRLYQSYDLKYLHRKYLVFLSNNLRMIPRFVKESLFLDIWETVALRMDWKIFKENIRYLCRIIVQVEKESCKCRVGWETIMPITVQPEAQSCFIV